MAVEPVEPMEPQGGALAPRVTAKGSDVGEGRLASNSCSEEEQVRVPSSVMITSRPLASREDSGKAAGRNAADSQGVEVVQIWLLQPSGQ